MPVTPVRKRLRTVYSTAAKFFGRQKLHEFMGEMVTSVVSHALGFEDADLKRHPVHGPDQIVRHKMLGGFGIFEAKGSKRGTLRRKRTSRGYQMSPEWISSWLKTIAGNNESSTDGRSLNKQFRGGTPMLAMVTHFYMGRTGSGRGSLSPVFRIGIQPYNPTKGDGLQPWTGFGGRF